MYFLFKTVALSGIFLLLFSTSILGETMYVSDLLKLTLRTGPSTENKILAVIVSGQKLDVIEYGDEWSRVQLSNGKEGWVLSRYLTSKETNNIKLDRLQEKHKNLMSQAASLLEENNELKAKNKELSAVLEANQKKLGKVNSDYETLKGEAGEFISLKSKYDQTSLQLAEQSQKVETLEAELTKLELNHYIKWFLAGSGVLIVGFLIGFSTKRQRRRASLI
jgi:SH3 domain protein